MPKSPENTIPVSPLNTRARGDLPACCDMRLTICLVIYLVIDSTTNNCVERAVQWLPPSLLRPPVGLPRNAQSILVLLLAPAQLLVTPPRKGVHENSFRRY